MTFILSFEIALGCKQQKDASPRVLKKISGFIFSY